MEDKLIFILIVYSPLIYYAVKILRGNFYSRESLERGRSILLVLAGLTILPIAIMMFILTWDFLQFGSWGLESMPGNFILVLGVHFILYIGEYLLYRTVGEKKFREVYWTELDQQIYTETMDEVEKLRLKAKYGLARQLAEGQLKKIYNKRFPQETLNMLEYDMDCTFSQIKRSEQYQKYFQDNFHEFYYGDY